MLAELPPELAECVAAFLPARDVLALGAVSTRVRRRVDSEQVWELQARRLAAESGFAGAALPRVPCWTWKQACLYHLRGRFQPVQELIEHPVPLRLFGSNIECSLVLAPSRSIHDLLQENVRLRGLFRVKQQIVRSKMHVVQLLRCLPLLLLTWLLVLGAEAALGEFFPYPFSHPGVAPVTSSRFLHDPFASLSAGSRRRVVDAQLLCPSAANATHVVACAALQSDTCAGWRGFATAVSGAAAMVWDVVARQQTLLLLHEWTPFFLLYALATAAALGRAATLPTSPLDGEVMAWQFAESALRILSHETQYRYVIVCVSMVFAVLARTTLTLMVCLFSCCGLAVSLWRGAVTGSLAPRVAAWRVGICLALVALHAIGLDAVTVLVSLCEWAFHVLTLGLHLSVAAAASRERTLFFASLFAVSVSEVAVHCHESERVRACSVVQVVLNAQLMTFFVLHYGAFNAIALCAAMHLMIELADFTALKTKALAACLCAPPRRASSL